MQPEALPTVSISSHDDNDFFEESDGEYDSEHDFDMDKRMQDDADAPYGVNCEVNVDMETDGDDEEEEDEEEEDEEEEDDNEDEDEDEDDGREPRMIGQGEMVYTLADNVDTMVDNQPIVLPQQGQEMLKYTP